MAKKIHRRRKPREVKHKKIIDHMFGRVTQRQKFLCPICSMPHTINQHRFHGVGSFEKTHGRH